MKINKIEKVNKTPREFPKKEEEDLNLKKLRGYFRRYRRTQRWGIGMPVLSFEPITKRRLCPT
jgi:hypothetical protein